MGDEADEVDRLLKRLASRQHGVALGQQEPHAEGLSQSQQGAPGASSSKAAMDTQQSRSAAQQTEQAFLDPWLQLRDLLRASQPDPSLAAVRSRSGRRIPQPNSDVVAGVDRSAPERGAQQASMPTEATTEQAVVQPWQELALPLGRRQELPAKDTAAKRQGEESRPMTTGPRQPGAQVSRQWWPRVSDQVDFLAEQPSTSLHPAVLNAQAQRPTDLQALASSNSGRGNAVQPAVPEDSPLPSADTAFTSVSSLSMNTTAVAAAGASRQNLSTSDAARPGSVGGTPFQGPKVRPLYSMVLLDGPSRKALLERVKPAFPTVSADHMTIRFKPDSGHLNALPIGEVVQLVGTGLAQDSKRQALMVQVQDISPGTTIQNPHVTISVQDTSAKSVGRLVQACEEIPAVQNTFCKQFDQPLHLSGTVCVKLTDMTTAFSREACPEPAKRPRPASAGPQPLARRKVNPRLSVQAYQQPQLSQGFQRRQEGQAVGNEEPQSEGAPAPHSASGATPPTVGEQQPQLGPSPVSSTGQEKLGTCSVSGRRTPAGLAGDGHDMLDEMLGRLGISRYFSPAASGGLGDAATGPTGTGVSGLRLGAEQATTLQPHAASLTEARQPTAGVALEDTTSAQSNASSSSNYADEEWASQSQNPSTGTLQLEALLQAWTIASTAAEAQTTTPSSQPPTLELHSRRRPPADTETSVTPAAQNRDKAEDPEVSFWAQLMGSSNGAGTESAKGAKAGLHSSEIIGVFSAKSTPGKDSKRKNSNSTKSRKQGVEQNTVPLKPSRPGKAVISRLWLPTGQALPSPATGASANPGPAKILRRGEMPAKDGPSLPQKSGRWVAVEPVVDITHGLREPIHGLSLSDCEADTSLAKLEAVPGETGGLSGRLHTFKLAAVKDCKRIGNRTAKPLKGNALKGMPLKGNPHVPKPAMKTKVAANKADETKDKVKEHILLEKKGAEMPAKGPSTESVEADNSTGDDIEDDDEDITGDPWWVARKLPGSTPDDFADAGPSDRYGKPAGLRPSMLDSVASGRRRKPFGPQQASKSAAVPEGDSDIVKSMLQVWQSAGGLQDARSGQPENRKSASMLQQKEQPRRQIYIMPVGLLEKQSTAADTRDQDSDKAGQCQQQTTNIPASMQDSSEEMLISMQAEVLAQGVTALTAEFPAIDKTVAELTLKSLEGDVDEAVSFLKLTSLTATPSQLSQLGLLASQEELAPVGAPQSSATLPTIPSPEDEDSTLGLGAPAKPGSGNNGAGSLADDLLLASNQDEAIALAISSAATTIVARQRLKDEAEVARRQWERHYKAKTILLEAAVQAEARGQKDVALMLRAQAHEQFNLAAEARQQCNARAFQGSNHGNTNKVKVDLHGMNVDEAREKLKKHITSLSGLSSATFILQVITGVGKHSFGGKAKLLPAVVSYLSARGLTWTEEPGNPGQINVILSGTQAH